MRSNAQVKKLIAAIDIGTNKICTLIGAQSPLGVDVIGWGISPSSGISKGNIENIPLATDALKASVEAAEARSGEKIKSAYVGITGTHLKFENRKDRLDWVGKHGVITSEELMKIPTELSSSLSSATQEVIHTIPVGYSIDGKNGIRNPLGMHASNLAVETHIVSASTLMINKMKDTMKGIGIEMDGLVMESFASSKSILTEEEKALGVALIDIGAGTTDISIHVGGAITHSAVIPVGGFQFTNDICVTYNTNFDAAEAVKINEAHTLPDTVRPLEEINLPVLGRVTGLNVPLRDICILMRERAQELMRLVVIKLRDAGIEDVSDFRLVFTGGGSQLTGLEDLARRMISGKVRTGMPHSNTGVPEELIDPSYSTAVGILLWGNTKLGSNNRIPVGNSYGADRRTNQSSNPSTGISKLLSAFKFN